MTTQRVVFSDKSDVLARVESVLGTARCNELSQAEVNQFADVTGDHQWIHVDTERAKDGPYSGTVVHGFYVLALIPYFSTQVYEFNNAKARINYGLDKVRFINPLPVGVGLIDEVSLISVKEKDAGQLLSLQHNIRRADNDSTVCVANNLSMILWKED